MDYDRENPPIKVGSTCASMSEFRGAMRQHAIKRSSLSLEQKSHALKDSGATAKLMVVHGQ